MVIINQEKEKMFNFDNIEFIEIAENKTTIRCQHKDLNCWLGNYKTEERAKEVLQDIYKQLKIQNFSFTYEMPKE